MNEIKKVVICGLGAIGTIFASKIQESDFADLKILADEKRIERYQKSPVVFNGVERLFDFVTPSFKGFEADLIIIATKNIGIEEAIENIKKFVGENTIILSFLNGIKSEEQIAEKYGENKVLNSYYMGHTSSRVGNEVTQDGVYKIVFGEKENTVLTERVQVLKSFFEKTGINFEIPSDMEYSMWWKFLVNVGYNQASAILNSSYEAFQKSPAVNNFAINLMEEARAVAEVSGVKNTEKMIPEILEAIKKMLPETRTSMLQDIDSKRQSEVDIFGGHVCALARKYNLKTPYNNMAFEIIKALDEKNSLV